MINNKIIFVLLILSLFLIPITVSSNEIKTYRNDHLGFEISYPSGWVKTQPITPDTALLIRNKKPSEIGSISVRTKIFKNNNKDWKKDFKDTDNLLAGLRKRFPDAEIIEQGDTLIGGFPAYFIFATYGIKNFTINVDVAMCQFFCRKDGRFYLINFETPLSLFERTFNHFEAILATFNFR